MIGDRRGKLGGTSKRRAVYTVFVPCPSLLEVGREVARKIYEDGIVKF